MAYRSVLGGSPLGLIGVRSAPNSSGLASFNIDKSRNVNVGLYNKSRGGSIIGGRKNLRAWLDIKKVKESKDPKGSKSVPDWANPGGTTTSQEESYQQQTLHNDSIYDMSVLNIIEKLASTQGALRPTDFAYLKDLGVYPNNRLMIARRFASAAQDNVVSYKTNDYTISAIATLIQWVPQDQDFLNISFGEEWESAEADFTGVIDSLGKDLGLNNLGGIGGAAGNLLPLPGFTEIFQREFLASIGLLEQSAASQIPAGNPNLIKEAKRRKTIGYGEAGSGLSTQLSIKFNCEYELKYISGIDPTMVWMDLISNIARFGTSESSFYGLSGSFAAKLNRWLSNPQTLISDVFKSISNAIGKITAKVKKFIQDAYDLATAAAADEKKAEDADDTSGDEEEDPYKDAKAEKALGERVLGQITKLLGKVTTSLIAKYRVRIAGIVTALTGAPSCPWHISIGNPLRPAFCSGDMIVRSVSLKLGQTLAFNDLPSSIGVEFTIENARPWGLQEIMAKFNSGYLRSVDVQKSFAETAQIPTKTTKTKLDDGTIVEEPEKNSPIASEKAGALPGENWVVIDENGNAATAKPTEGKSTPDTTSEVQGQVGNSTQQNTQNNSNSVNSNVQTGSASTSVTTSNSGTLIEPQSPSEQSGPIISGSENKTSAVNTGTSVTSTDLLQNNINYPKDPNEDIFSPLPG